jgi:hypothetical protein
MSTKWKAGNILQQLRKTSPWNLSLEEGLKIADSLWPTVEKATKPACYNFSLSRFPYGWVFNVVNSWQNWHDKGYETKFGAYKAPEYCIAAFLEYCIKKNIQPHKLLDK